MAKVTESTKALLRTLEGLRLSAYKDAHGYSIGYGHFGVKPNVTITLAKAESYLSEDLGIAVNYLNTLDGIGQYKQNEVDALASMAYNLGSFGFKLKAAIKSGNRSELKEVMRLYVMSQGVKLQSLVNRREKEIKHFEAGGGSGGALAVIGLVCLAGLV